MEKYAVDLDKVLDELEYNEDLAEQLDSPVNKRTANGSTPHKPYGVATRKSSAPIMHYRRPAFEPINLADADFAAAPQPSASYVESLYTPPVSTHNDNRHSGSHSQQNGVSTHIGSVFSSLNEFVSDNKTDLKNHSSSVWIQNNLADSKTAGKGKAEKRNGSLDVFISNMTLNSGGHVSECNTSDGLYYNEITKSSELARCDISGKQDIKIMRSNLSTAVSANKKYEGFLSKNLMKTEIISGSPNIIHKAYGAKTDGLECQTSESSVMGVDIACEAEGLECNSSNPCKEQNSANSSRVPENSNLETEVLESEKRPNSGTAQVTDSERNVQVNNFNLNKVISKENAELPSDNSEISVGDSVKDKNVCEDLLEKCSVTQNNVIEAAEHAIGFTSFADISDEELQQYLQELEDEVENESESLVADGTVIQNTFTGESGLATACVPTTHREQDNDLELTKADHSESLGEDAGKVSVGSGSVSNYVKINEWVVKAAENRDFPGTVTSDMNVTPADTGPPPPTVPAVVLGPSVSYPVSMPSCASQESVRGSASEDNVLALLQSADTFHKSNAAHLALLPVAKCDVSEKEIKNEGVQMLPSCVDRVKDSSVDNKPAYVPLSKPMSSVVDHASAHSDANTALLHSVKPNTSVAAGDDESTASNSATSRKQSTTPSTTQLHHDSHPVESTVLPQYSNDPPISSLPVDTVTLSSKTDAESSATAGCVSPVNKLPCTSEDNGCEREQVCESPPENEDPRQSDCLLGEEHTSSLAEVERTSSNSTAEEVGASPPSYDSVIDASSYKCSEDKDKCTLQEVNPFANSEVNVCSVRTPEETSSVGVLVEEEKPSRPHFLHLPSKINFDDQNVDPASSESLPAMLTYGPPGETPSTTPCLSVSDNVGSEGTVSSPDLSDTSSVEQAPSDSISDGVSPEDRILGKLPPYWVPDADAPSCMLCDLKFTVIKRRHHCRACGKVLCSKCCNLKSRLEYMDNSEARVCQPCFEVLARVYAVEQCESASGSPSSMQEASVGIGTVLGRRPNPNNPMEYCSTIPPMEQAASTLRQPPPSVLVPVGVLKREGSGRSKSDVTKQVMFSDGIRPGGDLTELDGSSEPRVPYRRPGRVLKRVGTPPGVLPAVPPGRSAQHKAQPVIDPKTNSFMPEQGLPPVVTLLNGDVRYEDDYQSTEKLIAAMKSETELPVVFALNRNFFVQVKILNLDCCVNRICWCFTTVGLRCVGQDEVLVVLECQQDEATVPQDIFLHLNNLYQDASKGVTVGELGYSLAQRSNFLGSADHGGFIYVRPTFQCLQKLVLPPAPFLVAILIHRWETPWARLFPIRLVLRLGAEFRYYPCMLVSVRQRKPVYCEIGHTIMNLLADFRNLSYTLPSVRGLVIHMEDRQTSIHLPRNRYDQVMRALNNSNDHVLAFAANLSQEADSHLVCIQGTDDESYHTQAINIHTKPRKVTGASFVVFNGALKSSLNLTAKSSIVEDGLMVQITADNMTALRTALRNMVDFTIGCGPCGVPVPDEHVLIKWVADDKNFNMGVRSCIDGKCLDGVPSIRVHNGTDYVGSSRFIRWTEVFIIQSEGGCGQSGDPLDISRLSESIAQATCLALAQLLDSLAEAGLTMLAVRADIHPDNVGYEAGSEGERLAPLYMNSLDNELVPVLHKAASSASDSPAATLELVFHIMLQ